jgi:hypothetical protein
LSQRNLVLVGTGGFFGQPPKTTKPCDEPAEAQSQTSALPQIIDRKIVLRDDPGAIRGAGRACVRDTRSTAPSMFAPPLC